MSGPFSDCRKAAIAARHCCQFNANQSPTSGISNCENKVAIRLQQCLHLILQDSFKVVSVLQLRCGVFDVDAVLQEVSLEVGWLKRVSRDHHSIRTSPGPCFIVALMTLR